MDEAKSSDKQQARQVKRVGWMLLRRERQSPVKLHKQNQLKGYKGKTHWKVTQAKPTEGLRRQNPMKGDQQQGAKYLP